VSVEGVVRRDRERKNRRKKEKEKKVNKTCLGRFQDCGRGKGKNM
jgi:hypothetical protein